MSDNLGPTPGATNSTSSPDSGTHSPSDGGSSLPVPAGGDAGKVLTVKGDETGYELDVPSGGGGATIADVWMFSTSQTVPATTETALTGWDFDDAPVEWLTVTDGAMTLDAGLYLASAHLNSAASDGGEMWITTGGDDDNTGVPLRNGPHSSTDVVTVLLRYSSAAAIGVSARLLSEHANTYSNLRIAKLA